MTSLADVLAASIKERLAEHGYAMSSDTAQDIASHQAEAVAAAGLAVVALPEPDREKPRVWRGSFGMAFYATVAGTVGTPDGSISVAEARADAAALLAAANAAEQVTR